MLSSITKENFNQLLGRFSTSELETLLEKHPYFQQAHVLLAKKYQQENNPKFDEQLQLAALYTQDREFLYSIFSESNSEPFPSLVSPPSEKDIESVVEAKLPEPVNEEIVVEDVNTFSPEWEEEVKEAEEVITISPEEEIRTEEKPQEEMEAPADVVVEHASNDINEQEEVESPVIVADETIAVDIPEEKPLEDVIVEEGISAKTEEEVLPPFTEVPEEEIVLETEQPVLPEPVIEEVKETFRTSEPHTFDEWLSAFAQPDIVKPEFSQEEASAEPEKQKDELEELIMSNLQIQGLVEEETHYSKGLDTFIEEQKQKHKPKETRKPTDENELAPELITETMAKVYEMQKKYPKAIRAYEILALKYPEKNDFFAARINYLKNIT